MPIDDIYEVVTEFDLHSQRCVNVYHFKGSNNFASLEDLINDVISCIRTSLLPALSVDCKLINVRGKTIYPALSDEAILSGNAGDVGGIATGGDVSFAAGLMSLRTGLGGRSNRGRKFIAGLPEDGVTASRLTTGELAALLTFATCLAGKFISNTSTDPYFIGVLSRKKMKPPTNATALAAFRSCTSISVSSVVSTQVRRKIGRGQ
jgi:hypothetical protein